MNVATLQDGAKGFDANRTISAVDAAAFVAHGYQFGIRYVRRHDAHSYDLTAGEVTTILTARLGLMVVQHVANEGWVPTPDDGALYGNTAARESHEVGVPSGVTVWCDLEGVKSGTSHADVTGFCDNWFDEVAAAGYVPGLYVGFGCGLTADELYNLKFGIYWGAYNVNSDSVPTVRGFCMKQSVAKPADLISGYTNQNMDVDTVHIDALGGLPTALLP
jgi:hypothetical protein